MKTATDSSSENGIKPLITDDDDLANSHPDHTRLIITMIVGSILFLAAGFAVSILLGMRLFDRIEFLLSLSVVDILGCTFYAAWKTRSEES